MVDENAENTSGTPKELQLGVRRHINWNNLRPDLKEDLAHLVQDIRRLVCGIAIAVSPSF